MGIYKQSRSKIRIGKGAVAPVPKMAAFLLDAVLAIFLIVDVRFQFGINV